MGRGTKVLLWILAAVIVIGGIGYFAFGKQLGISADTVSGTSSNGLTWICPKSNNTQDVIFPREGSNIYKGTMVQSFNNPTYSSGWSEDGSWVVSGNSVYFTDGIKYTSKPALAPGKDSVFDVGEYWVLAYSNSGIKSNVTGLTKNSGYIVYRGNLYKLSKTNMTNIYGPIYQYNGYSSICLPDKKIYEIDLARHAQLLLLDNGIDKKIAN